MHGECEKVVSDFEKECGYLLSLRAFFLFLMRMGQYF